MANKINEKLKSFRKYSGLSQEAFAQKLGVSFTTINRWENGHAEPNKLARKNLLELWHETGFDYEDKNQENKFKILIVDDEPNVITMIKRALSKLDFDILIETADDGYDAGLKASSFKPDLVLLDVFMPGIQGDVVCQKIKQNPVTADIYLIVMSGNLDEQLRNKLLDFGADLVVEKPLDQDQLEHVIYQQRKLKSAEAEILN
jgi:CheY-like chemotaxis protein/DNA-binding XRE family transcriptional regulator